MGTSKSITQAYYYAQKLAKDNRHEFIWPEHLLYTLLMEQRFQEALAANDISFEEMMWELDSWLPEQEKLPEWIELEPTPSYQFGEMSRMAFSMALSAERSEVGVTHFMAAMMQLHDSQAAYVLNKYVTDKGEFEAALIKFYPSSDEGDTFSFGNDDMSDYGDDGFDDYGQEAETPSEEAWRQMVTCITDQVDRHNPLIGRDVELERTIEILSRKDKNNPLHVGEPGVGKTSIVYGLAERIRRGEVPEGLKKCRIYQMDMGSMLAGTQYRGDFEKRMNMVMQGVSREGNAIVYLDEIHNIIGAGRTNDGGPDASNMLKPYLEQGDIRFIGSTTYEEYNKHFARQGGIVRRFQQVDILEPSVEDAISILKGLQGKYESFHGVCYKDEAIDYAVRASAKYISDRFLPDKAIDLMDEAGAYRKIHPLKAKQQLVTKDLVRRILAKVCKIDAVVMKEEDNASLKTLRKRIAAKIYGQDEAVTQVVEAVQMSKAGLSEDNKPLASLLFVGPTGVGKTEVARVLAKELGVELVRFDMSEYTEKHAVAKLIGAPAGYVGYEDGGLLTAAIRKSPNCVLLLDETEKAHQDIYNILLQVMDYAKLTDNRGQKTDFRNVVLIMTSNAGAQFASQANVGFSSKVSRGEAMLTQVKKMFKPEFINRLSSVVVFRDMDKAMATLILNKKIGELGDMLKARHVVMKLSKDAAERLLREGFTPEYGAREIDRVIARRLKPLLMREILFGSLRKGGEVLIGLEGEGFVLHQATTERKVAAT